MDHDDLLTLPEIATILGVNPSTVRLWVNEGRLPAHKAGGRKWLVYRHDLQQMLGDQPSIGHPRRAADERSTPKDWSEIPEQATLDLASSAGLARETL